MRKLVVILLPLLPLFIQGQLLNTVDQIAAYNNPYGQIIFVKDTIRGGHFMPYNGNNAVDNGMIFQDAIGRKWIRQSNVDYLNIDWFGAKNDGSDSRGIFLNTLASAKLNLPVARIRIPRSYYFSDSININSYVEIFGDGPQSQIQFPQHKSGITFLFSGSQNSKLSDIHITAIPSSYSLPNTWDSSKHGIRVKSPMILSNVWVSNFDGCGFYVVNDLTSPIDSGNSNTAKFFNCKSFFNLLHGVYIRGGDANAMVMQGWDVYNNGASGIYDKSFLGNTYSYNHSATNGSPEVQYQRGLVKYNGSVYACIKDTTKNVLPTNTSNWQDIGIEFINYVYVQTYDATKTYWATGSYILENANQRSSFINNYAELDQAPGYLDNGNIDYGSNVVWRNSPSRLYSNLGRLTSQNIFSSDIGITSRWVYGGNLESYVDATGSYPTYAGLFVGSNNKSGIINLYDNNVKIGEISTTASKLKISATTVDIIGTLQNNGSPISGGGISQQTLDDSTSALRTTINSKQDVLVSNTNIKTIGGQNVLGTGNIVTTNSQTFVNLTNNFSSSSTTPAAVTGWSFAVTNGVTYRVTVIASHQTAATTTGGIIGISLTAATGTVRGSARGSIVSTAANSELAIPIVATSGAGSTLTTTGVTAINSPHFIGLDVIFICTGSGTFNIVWGTEVNASAAQLNAGSALIYQALN